MMKYLTAVAIAIALPAAAYAADPAPQPKQDCCEKMTGASETSHAGRHDVSDAGKECCCKDMDHQDHAKQGEHAGHDAHAGHQR